MARHPWPACSKPCRSEAVVREVFVSRQRRADAPANLEGLSHAAQTLAARRDYFHTLNAAEQRPARTAQHRQPGAGPHRP